MNKKLFDVLNTEVANFSVLYEKLHHFHWFVKGQSFFTLHEKFEEDYTEVTSYVDELAERLLMVGETPVSSLREYLEATTLIENQKQFVEADEMVKALVKDYKQLMEELQVGIELAGEAGDSVTEDLLVGIVSSLHKKVWMYTAFLK